MRSRFHDITRHHRETYHHNTCHRKIWHRQVRVVVRIFAPASLRNLAMSVTPLGWFVLGAPPPSHPNGQSDLCRSAGWGGVAPTPLPNPAVLGAPPPSFCPSPKRGNPTRGCCFAPGLPLYSPPGGRYIVLLKPRQCFTKPHRKFY